MADLKVLVGQTVRLIAGVEQFSVKVYIETEEGGAYCFLHIQDCCESVSLADFELDDDLSGALILEANEFSSEPQGNHESEDESETWTFYRIDTTKGSLWMRWIGSSNGYYSEAVDFVDMNYEEDTWDY